MLPLAATQYSDVNSYPIILSGAASDNYDFILFDGILNITPATVHASAQNKSKEYGSDNPTFTISYSGFLNGDDETGIIEPLASTTATSLSGVGPYPIQLNGGSSLNYDIVNHDGILTVTLASLIASADNKTKTYGAAVPPLTISYTGFVNGDNPSNITAPTISTTATSLSPVNTYPITLIGGTAANYTITRTNGVLSVTKAILTVTADTKSIYQGSSTPTYTSTITGFVPGGQNTIQCYPSYTVSPNCVGSPGVYTITPKNMVLSQPGNYQIVYVPGYLYINPKGGSAKKIKPILNCVDTLVGHPSGFAYVAHFSYENANSTPVYVPIGSDNIITALGSYSGVQPMLFTPGGGNFDIYFDGLKLTWTVKTYQGNSKTAVASDASVGSARCTAHLRMTQKVSDNKLPSEIGCLS